MTNQAGSINTDSLTIEVKCPGLTQIAIVGPFSYQVPAVADSSKISIKNRVNYVSSTSSHPSCLFSGYELRYLVGNSLVTGVSYISMDGAG